MNTKKISCLIIDDDDFARETLCDLLSIYSNIEIIKTIKDSITAIKYIATLKPDLVFLDINMPNKDGFSVMNEIVELNIQTEVIFVTAHQEFLMKALKQNAFDYIIKPINKNELNEAIERFSAKTNTNNEQLKRDATANLIKEEKIILKNSHGSLYLKPDDIIYLNAEGCYTYINLIDGKTETISKNIGSIENLFPTQNFYRISRSVIINLKYISKINRLKRLVFLNINNTHIELKASKERLYDLEALVK